MCSPRRWVRCGSASLASWSIVEASAPLTAIISTPKRCYKLRHTSVCQYPDLPLTSSSVNLVNLRRTATSALMPPGPPLLPVRRNNLPGQINGMTVVAAVQQCRPRCHSPLKSSSSSCLGSTCATALTASGPASLPGTCTLARQQHLTRQAASGGHHLAASRPAALSAWEAHQQGP